MKQKNLLDRSFKLANGYFKDLKLFEPLLFVSRMTTLVYSFDGIRHPFLGNLCSVGFTILYKVLTSKLDQFPTLIEAIKSL